MQVVNALIRNNKDFDLLVIPGAGHGSGGAYGDHKRFDFFATAPARRQAAGLEGAGRCDEEDDADVLAALAAC